MSANDSVFDGVGGELVLSALPDGHVTDVALTDALSYTGMVRNGKLHGEGTLTSSTDVYTGGFLSSQRHGHGVLRATVDAPPSGITEYAGNWLMHLPDGNGRIVWANGDTYTGLFCKGKPHGAGGRCAFADGRVYEGEYEMGVRHGRGKLTQRNGEYYDGDFVQGAMTGRGTAFYAGGKRVFEGVWNAGKKVTGKMTFDGSGRMYDGEWLNEKPHGSGEMVFANGDHYVGDFVGGKLCGLGVMTYQSQGGKVFTGAFRDDRPHGHEELRAPADLERNGRAPSGHSSADDFCAPPPTNGAAAVDRTKRDAHGADPAPPVSSAAAPSPPSARPTFGTESSMESCSRLSRKEEAEIQAVSASVIAGVSTDGCKGWMEKYSIGRGRFSRFCPSNWRRRYFILASFSKVVSLSYYEDELCRKPVAFIRLNTDDTRIVTRPSLRTHKEARRPGRDICVVYRERGGEFKLLLRADSEEEHDYWSESFRRLFSIIDHSTDYPQLSSVVE